MRLRGKNINGKTIIFSALIGCPNDVVLSTIQKGLGIQDINHIEVFEGDEIRDDYTEDGITYP